MRKIADPVCGQVWAAAPVDPCPAAAAAPFKDGIVRAISPPKCTCPLLERESCQTCAITARTPTGGVDAGPRPWRRPLPGGLPEPPPPTTAWCRSRPQDEAACIAVGPTENLQKTLAGETSGRAFMRAGVSWSVGPRSCVVSCRVLARRRSAARALSHANHANVPTIVLPCPIGTETEADQTGCRRQMLT